MDRSETPPRASRALRPLAVTAGGAWGSVAGGYLLGLLAQALGAPPGTGEGELVPGLGWNRFTAFLLGLPIGCALGAWGALRVVERWPRTVGLPMAVVGAVVVVTALADPSLWRVTLLMLLVAALPVVTFLPWRSRRIRA